MQSRVTRDWLPRLSMMVPHTARAKSEAFIAGGGSGKGATRLQT
jgi:hypothetical protein